MTINESAYKRWYSVFASVVVATVIARCYFVPFSHDEVATFFFYIQPGDFIPFRSHPDANGHFLTNLSSWLCFKLFGSSAFALRLPDIVAAVIALIAGFKISQLLTSFSARLLLIASTVGAYNFMAYFALCRGYGLSMAFLMAALASLLLYFKYSKLKHVFLSLLFLQLGLAANLTFVAVVGLISAFIVLQLFLHKQFFKPLVLLALALNFFGLLFWVKYGLYLKEAGALYYGAGESYWQVTFLSLINSMLAKSPLINGIVVLVFALMSIDVAVTLVKRGWQSIFTLPKITLYVIFIGLVFGFFFLKLVAGVNYPEDRTGLFFYLLFFVLLAFVVDTVKAPIQNLALLVPAAMVVQYTLQFDLQNHPWRVYETMPKAFYDTLSAEQAKSKTPITIGGHRVREFFYGFLNYNSPTKLNHITAPEALQLNTDYALAYKQDKPYYANFYNEIAAEDKWGFRLIKRKQAIERKVVAEKSDYEALSNNFEYANFFEIKDTVFLPKRPIQADITLSCENTAVPMNVYVVMEIQSANETEPTQFIRVPLNLIKYDWNKTKQFSTSIVSGNLPSKLKRLVIYLWNIEKQQNQITINSFTLSELKAPGITLISKAAI